MRVSFRLLPLGAIVLIAVATGNAYERIGGSGYELLSARGYEEADELGARYYDLDDRSDEELLERFDMVDEFSVRGYEEDFDGLYARDISEYFDERSDEEFGERSDGGYDHVRMTARDAVEDRGYEDVDELYSRDILEGDEELWKRYVTTEVILDELDRRAGNAGNKKRHKKKMSRRKNKSKPQSGIEPSTSKPESNSDSLPGTGSGRGRTQTRVISSRTIGTRLGSDSSNEGHYGSTIEQRETARMQDIHQQSKFKNLRKIW